MSKLINKPELMKKYLRLMLRTVPIIPGPELLDIFEELKKSNSGINAKIDKAYESLRETSSLINDLESELIDRTNKVENLRNEYEKYSKLAQIEETEAKALISQLEITFNRGKNKERLLAIFINLICGFVIFISGIFLSPLITGYISASAK